MKTGVNCEKLSYIVVVSFALKYNTDCIFTILNSDEILMMYGNHVGICYSSYAWNAHSLLLCSLQCSVSL